MLFNSIPFIFFFYPISLAGYYLLGSLGRSQLVILWLILCSLCFYAWWNVIYVFLLIATMVFNYYLGVQLSKGSKYAKTVFVFGVGVDLGLLAYFKYTNFLIDTFNHLFHGNYSIGEIILPLGISFYTFQQIAYRLEAYQGKRKDDTFLNYCACVTFFPHLIAGPIVRYGALMPQFVKPEFYRFNSKNMSIGITLFTVGLIKKVVIADSCGLRANPLFAQVNGGHTLPFFESWAALLCFTLQIYFDFSGYSDMALGLARTFNIELPINFNSPYKARSIIEFWSRSHVTLSHFFRDHVYQPLSRAIAKPGRKWMYFCVFFTMTLSGIWHGAGWTFVFYGVVHGTFSVINYVYRRYASMHMATSRDWLRETLRTEFYWVLTFTCIALALVLFRCNNLESVGRMLRALFGFSGRFFDPAADSFGTFLKISALVAFVKWAPNIYEIIGEFFDDNDRGVATLQRYPRWMTWTPRPAIGLGLALSYYFLIYKFFDAAQNEFVYFKF